MRNIILISFLFIGQFSFGQKTQIAFSVNSGLFSFGGATSSSASYIIISDVSSIPDDINNPYGTSSGFSYGLSVHLQKLTPKNFIYGLQLSYESLSSKLAIDRAYGKILWTVSDGHVILTSNFINLFPSVGKRFKFIEGVESDLHVGLDLGIGLSSKERYRLTTSLGGEFSGSNEIKIPNIDFRPRIEFINYHKRFGLSVGYSYGLTNYTSGDGEAKGRYFRLGLIYRLKATTKSVLDGEVKSCPKFDSLH